MFYIHKNTIVANQIHKFIIEAPDIARKAQPGQFVIIRVTGKGERIPLTIADADPGTGTITLYVQVIGKTTSAMAGLKSGSSIPDVAGPLGRPTQIERFGTVVCVAGGVGGAVMFPIIRALKKQCNFVITILGARSADYIVLADDISRYSDEFFVATDDGSQGFKGFVTDKLRELFNDKPAPLADRVFACGPVPMMQSVSELTRGYGIPAIVSLNPIMVDGTGMCGACRVTVDGVTKFACVDGPEFNGNLVDWEELSRRLKMFASSEQAALRNHCDCQTKHKKGAF